MSLGFLDSCTFLMIFMNSVLSLNSFLKGLMFILVPIRVKK